MPRARHCHSFLESEFCGLRLFHMTSSHMILGHMAATVYTGLSPLPTLEVPPRKPLSVKCRLWCHTSERCVPTYIGLAHLCAGQKASRIWWVCKLHPSQLMYRGCLLTIAYWKWLGKESYCGANGRVTFQAIAAHWGVSGLDYIHSFPRTVPLSIGQLWVHWSVPVWNAKLTASAWPNFPSALCECHIRRSAMCMYMGIDWPLTCRG